MHAFAQQSFDLPGVLYTGKQTNADSRRETFSGETAASFLLFREDKALPESEISVTIIEYRGADYQKPIFHDPVGKHVKSEAVDQIWRYYRFVLPHHVQLARGAYLVHIEKVSTGEKLPALYLTVKSDSQNLWTSPHTPYLPDLNSTHIISGDPTTTAPDGAMVLDGNSMYLNGSALTMND